MVNPLMGALEHALKPQGVFPEVMKISRETCCIRFSKLCTKNTCQPANPLQMLTIADFSVVIICRFCIIIPDTGLHI